MSPRDTASPLRVAVLISGGGTTLKNLLDKLTLEQLPISIELVISSNGQAQGLGYAETAGIATAVVRPEACQDPAAFSEAIFAPCRERGVELVVMGGFIRHVLIPADFVNRVMNIHPGLIPAFCGKGFYGLRVHRAVLEYGAKISGCTVHFVDNEYDHGPIILQRAVPVTEDDTPETLQQRVFQEECSAYPDALRLFAEGRLSVVNRHVRVKPAVPGATPLPDRETGQP